MNHHLTISRAQYAAAFSLLAVFIIDILTPAVFVVDILYLSSILLVFRENTFVIRVFTIVACLLILVTELVEYIAEPGAGIWANGLIAVAAILAISWLTGHYRKLSKRNRLQQDIYQQSLEEMLHITSHKVRRPVASILGLIHVIHADCGEISGEELKQRCIFLNEAATELDEFIVELNDFIEHTERHHRDKQQ